MIRRNDFLKIAGASVASTALSPTFAANSNAPSKKRISIFTKPFQHMSYHELAETVADIGADGLEFPLRPKGHIEPEKAADELPKLVEALDKCQLKVDILASGIQDITSPHVESILKTAKSLGITKYRMNYFRYDLKKSIPNQLNEIKPKLKDLVAMNKDLGVQALYQNHSGSKYVGAPLWDVFQLFEPHDPKYLALAFDIGHATVEGGKSWPLQYQLLKPHIQAIYVKEALWQNKTLKWTSLGEGQVDKRFFKTIQKDQLPGPISLHVEYISHKDPKNLPIFIQAFKKDLKTLKSWL